MRGQKEWAVPPRRFRMPGKKVARTEQADEAYLLQVDRQTKRSFKTAEAARSAALEIKTRFPALQVSIYDGSSKSRTVVGLPGSAS